MYCVNITNPPRSRMFGHIDIDDNKIRRTIKVGIMRPAGPDAISRFAQPFLEQISREVVFLVYHDVQSVLILQLPRRRISQRAASILETTRPYCNRHLAR